MQNLKSTQQQYTYAAPIVPVIASATGLSKAQEAEVERKLRSFGASFNSNPIFAANTTHVISNCMGSNKMKIARSNGVPIVMLSWVDACLREFKSNPSSFGAIRIHELTQAHLMKISQSISPIETTPPEKTPIRIVIKHKADITGNTSTNITKTSPNNSENSLSSNSKSISGSQGVSAINVEEVRASLKPSLDSVVSQLPEISPILIGSLMNGTASTAHIGLLNVDRDAEIDSLLPDPKHPFKSATHMLQCLVIYHSVLTVRSQYMTDGMHLFTRPRCRRYNSFLAFVIGKLDAGCLFANVSRFVVHHLELSLQDSTYDFSELEDFSLWESDEGVIAAGREDNMDCDDDGDIPADASLTANAAQDDIPEFSLLFKEFLAKVHTSRGLSVLMVRPDFVELFGTSNRDALVQAISATVSKLCKESRNMWHDSDFWALLNDIAESKVNELCEVILFGTTAPAEESTGLLDALTSTPCESLSAVDVNRINSVLDVFLESEEAKQRILDQQDSYPSAVTTTNTATTTSKIPLLLTALRNGAGPMILYLTEELNVLMSRTVPETEEECPWALLETARSGSWAMLQQLLSSGDMGRVFDGSEEPLVRYFLKRYNKKSIRSKAWKALGIPVPEWSTVVSSVTLLGASFGNADVFTPLLESLTAADIQRGTCSIDVEWAAGSGDNSSFRDLSQFDMALLGGFLEEAKMILEVLLEDKDETPIKYNPVVIVRWLVWMTECHGEPAPPSLYPDNAALTLTSKSSILVKEIITMLGDDGLDSLIFDSQWPSTLPFELYAREWITPQQMNQFIDSEQFEHSYTGKDTTSLLCWASWRFDVQLLSNYVPSISDKKDILLEKTHPEKESWLHLLSHRFLEPEVKKDRSCVRLVMTCVGNAEVFTSVNSRGKSVRDVWEGILGKVDRAGVAEVKRILALIDQRINEFKLAEKEQEAAAANGSQEQKAIELSTDIASNIADDGNVTVDDAPNDMDIDNGTDTQIPPPPSEKPESRTPPVQDEKKPVLTDILASKMAKLRSQALDTISPSGSPSIPPTNAPSAEISSTLTTETNAPTGDTATNGVKVVPSESTVTKDDPRPEKDAPATKHSQSTESFPPPAPKPRQTLGSAAESSRAPSRGGAVKLDRAFAERRRSRSRVRRSRSRSRSPPPYNSRRRDSPPRRQSNNNNSNSGRRAEDARQNDTATATGGKDAAARDDSSRPRDRSNSSAGLPDPPKSSKPTTANPSPVLMNRQKSNLGNGAVLGNPPPVLIHEKKRVGENSGGLSLGLGAPPPAPTPPPPPPPVVTRIIQEKRKRFDSEDDIVDYGDGDDDDSVQGSGNSYVIPSKIFQPSISSGSYKGVDMSLPVPKSRKFNEVIDLTGDHIDSGVGSSINNNGLNTAASSSSSSHKLPISERIGKKPAIMERLGGKKEDPFVIDSASPSPSRNLGSGGYVGSGSGSRGSPRHTQTNNANATAGTTAATATVAVATAMSSAPFVSSSSSATTTSSSRTSIFERLGGSHKPEFNESKGSEYSSSQIAERLGGGGGGGGSRGSGGRTGNSTSGSGGKLPPPPAVAAIPVYTRIIPQHNAAVPLSTLVSPPGYAIPQQQQQQQQHQDAFLQRYAYPQSSYFPTYPFGPGYGSGGGGGGGGSLNLGTVGSGGGGGGYSSSLSYPSSSGVLGRNSGRDNDQSRKDRSPNGAKGGDGSSSSSNSRDGNRGSVERRVEDGVIRRRF